VKCGRSISFAQFVCYNYNARTCSILWTNVPDFSSDENAKLAACQIQVLMCVHITHQILQDQTVGISYVSRQLGLVIRERVHMVLTKEGGVTVSIAIGYNANVLELEFDRNGYHNSSLSTAFRPEHNRGRVSLNGAHIQLAHQHGHDYLSRVVLYGQLFFS
jgi:hypothetical protein